MVVGRCTAPYPLTMSRPSESTEYTDSAICGQPKAFVERYTTSSGKFHTSESPAPALVICVMPSSKPCARARASERAIGVSRARSRGARVGPRYA